MESWKLELYHAVPIGSIPEEDRKYGIPEQKKFPMPDKQHVLSAIKFFNYVTPKYEKQLAKAIIARMKEYGMSFDDFGVGEDNRFHKYIPEKYLAHHGILGMKWGIRRFQNKDGSLTKAGKQHREELNESNDLNKSDEFSKEIADYPELNEVSSFRTSDNKKDRTKAVDFGLRALLKADLATSYADEEELNENLDSFREWFYFEDQTIGYPEIAHMVLKGYSKDKILKACKEASDISKKDYSNESIWNLGYVNDYEFSQDNTKYLDACIDLYNEENNKEFKHHGILGQKWGVRRYQNEDGSLTVAGMKRRAQQIDKSNAKYLKKYGETINKKVSKAVEPYMNVYAQRELNTSVRKLKKNGKDSKKYIYQYNKKLATLMNTAVGDLKNEDTGYAVQFIAKRGEYGVHTALAAPGTDMTKYKSGVYNDGRIAYRKEGVKTV